MHPDVDILKSGLLKLLNKPGSQHTTLAMLQVMVNIRPGTQNTTIVIMV